jgi:hypothetical protein
MNFSNGWNFVRKDKNRFEFKVRVSIVTVFELFFDWSDMRYRLTLVNYTIGN